MKTLLQNLHSSIESFIQLLGGFRKFKPFCTMEWETYELQFITKDCSILEIPTQFEGFEVTFLYDVHGCDQDGFNEAIGFRIDFCNFIERYANNLIPILWTQDVLMPVYPKTLIEAIFKTYIEYESNTQSYDNNLMQQLIKLTSKFPRVKIEHFLNGINLNEV